MESKSKNEELERRKNPEIYQDSKDVETKEQLTNDNDLELCNNSATNLHEKYYPMISSELDDTSGKTLSPLSSGADLTLKTSDKRDETLPPPELSNDLEISESSCKAIQLDEALPEEIADGTSSKDCLLTSGTDRDGNNDHSPIIPEIAENQQGNDVICPSDKDQFNEATCNATDSKKEGSTCVLRPSDINWLLCRSRKQKKFDEDHLKEYRTLRVQGLDHDAIIKILTPPKRAIPSDLPPRVPSANISLSNNTAEELFGILDNDQKELFRKWREAELDREDAFTQVLGAECVIAASRMKRLLNHSLLLKLAKGKKAGQENQVTSSDSVISTFKLGIDTTPSNQEDFTNKASSCMVARLVEGESSHIQKQQHEPREEKQGIGIVSSNEKDVPMEASSTVPGSVEGGSSDLLQKLPLVREEKQGIGIVSSNEEDVLMGASSTVPGSVEGGSTDHLQKPPQVREEKQGIGIVSSNEEDVPVGASSTVPGSLEGGFNDLQKQPIKDRILSCANKVEKFDERQLSVYNYLREQGLEHDDALSKLKLGQLLPRVPSLDVKLTKKQLAKLLSTLNRDQMTVYNEWRKQNLDRQDGLLQILGAERMIEEFMTAVALPTRVQCADTEQSHEQFLGKHDDALVEVKQEDLPPRVPSVDVKLTSNQLNKLQSTLNKDQQILYKAWRKQNLDCQDVLTQILGAECILKAAKIVEKRIVEVPELDYENPRDIMKKPTFKASLTRNKCRDLFKIFNKPTRQLYEFFIEQGSERQDAVIQVLDCSLPKERIRHKCRHIVSKFNEDKKKVYSSLKDHGWSPSEAATVVHDISVGPVQKFNKNKSRKKKLKLAEKRLNASMEKAQRRLNSHQNISGVAASSGHRVNEMPLNDRSIHHQVVVNEVQVVPRSNTLNHPILGQIMLPGNLSSNNSRGLPVNAVSNLPSTVDSSTLQGSRTPPICGGPGSTSRVVKKDAAAVVFNRSRVGGESSPHQAAGMQHKLNFKNQNIAQGSSRVPPSAGLDPSSSLKRKDFYTSSELSNRSRFGEQLGPSSSMNQNDLYTDSTLSKRSRFGERLDPYCTAETQQRLNSPYQTVAYDSSKTSPVSGRSRFGEQPSPYRSAGAQQSSNYPHQSNFQGSSRALPPAGPVPSSSKDYHAGSTSNDTGGFGYNRDPYCSYKMQQPEPSPSSTNPIHLSIVSFGYPNQRFSENQLDQIENLILQAISEIGNGMKPTFDRSFRRNGCLDVICQDQFSKEWLYKYASYVRAPFKIIPGEAYKVSASVILPLCPRDDNDRILKFIANQNQGLNVRQWEVVERRDSDWNTSLSLMIDEESANVLKRLKKVSFKLGSAQIIVNDDTNDDDGYYY